MKTHPALTMLYVWIAGIAAFFILPFELTSRSLSAEGFMALALFIAAFCLGAIFRAPIMRQGIHPASQAPNLHVVDLVFSTVGMVTIIVFAFDYFGGSFATLEDSYESRNERASAMMTGEASTSSIYFKIGFVLYPSSFALIAREMIFRDQIDLVKLGIFGMLPIVMAALVMGGRGPILLSIVVLVASWRVRAMRLRAKGVKRKRLGRKQVAQIAVGIVAGLVTMNYFVQVFIIRAEISGGVDQMLGLAAQIWGVDFRGPGSDILLSTIGEGNTYLIFVFIWYLVQGIVMSNALFTDYDGEPALGIYGIELLTALMRRLDPNFVTDRYIVLFDMNVFGFLPSAWGSLYVDFFWFGLVIAFGWGLLCAIVYAKTRTSLDQRWLLVGPLVTMGIFFSLINTPIGFSNGLVTHFWFVLIFLLARPQTLRGKSPRANRLHRA